MSVQRYDLSLCDGDSGRCYADIVPEIGGDWCRAEDVEALESENAALKAEVARARSDYEYARSALWAAAGVFIEDDTEALRAVLTRIDARQHADGLLAKAQAEVVALRAEVARLDALAKPPTVQPTEEDGA